MLENLDKHTSCKARYHPTPECRNVRTQHERRVTETVYKRVILYLQIRHSPELVKEDMILEAQASTGARVSGVVPSDS